MKTIRNLILFLSIIACLSTLFISCTIHVNEPVEPEILYRVSYRDPDGNVLFTDEIKSPELFVEIPMDNVTVDGKVREFLHWRTDVDEDEKLITATAVYVDNLPKTGSSLHYDIMGNYFDPENKNSVLVVFVSFTDGYKIDRSEFEALFTGEYDTDNCMYSVSSYYKTVSYGRDLLDFTFAYYDSGMTSAEAWHYVNDEDKNGNFVGKKFFEDIFLEMRKNGIIDTTKLDSDGDGYVDASFFVFGDKIEDDWHIYGDSSGCTSTFDFPPDKVNPTLGKYVKTGYYNLTKKTIPADLDKNGIRIPLHETGHLFGVSDYYDFYWYNDTLISCLGGFDMQDHDHGDWNPFSKFACGWLHPYVITPDIESVTLRLRCSATHDEAILIPTSRGWNGSAFDEYLLVDVLAPEGPSGFDWEYFTYDDNRNQAETPVNSNGGIRIQHVDARLMYINSDIESYVRIEDLSELTGLHPNTISFRYYNTNGCDPTFASDSRYYHLLEYIPCDGTSKIRICTSTSFSLYTEPCSRDLFGAGASFSQATHSAAFANGLKTNNGGSIDYTITVDEYDVKTHEAIVTITKIK